MTPCPYFLKHVLCQSGKSTHLSVAIVFGSTKSKYFRQLLEFFRHCISTTRIKSEETEEYMLCQTELGAGSFPGRLFALFFILSVKDNK
jgi:hypothetical protein